MRSAVLLSVLAFCIVCFSPLLVSDRALADDPVHLDTIDPAGNHIGGHAGLWQYVGGGTSVPVEGPWATPCTWVPDHPSSEWIWSLRGTSDAQGADGVPLAAGLGDVQAGKTLFVDPYKGNYYADSSDGTWVKFVFYTIQLDTVDPAGNHIAGQTYLWRYYGGLQEGPWPTPCAWVQDRAQDGYLSLCGTCGAQQPDGIAQAVGLGAEQPDKTLLVDPYLGNYYVDSPGVTAIKFVFYAIQFDTVDPGGRHIAGQVDLWNYYQGLKEGPWRTPCPWIQDRAQDGYTYLRGYCDAQGTGSIPLSVGLNEQQQGKTLFVDPYLGNYYVDSPGVTAIKFVFYTIQFDTIDPSGNHIPGQADLWNYYQGLKEGPWRTPCPWVQDRAQDGYTYLRGYCDAQGTGSIPLSVGLNEQQQGKTLFVDPYLGNYYVDSPGVTAIKFVFYTIQFDTIDPSGNHIPGQADLWNYYQGLKEGPWRTPCPWVQDRAQDGYTYLRGYCDAQGTGSIPLSVGLNEQQQGKTLYVNPYKGKYYVDSGDVTAIKFVFYTIQLDTVDSNGQHIAGQVGLWNYYNGPQEGSWRTPCPWVQDRAQLNGWAIALYATCDEQGPDGVPLYVGIDAMQPGKTLFVDPNRGNYYVDSEGVTAIRFVFHTVQLDTVDPSGQHIAGRVGLWNYYSGLQEGPWRTACQWVQDRAQLNGWAIALYATCDAWGPDGAPVCAGIDAVQPDTTFWTDTQGHTRRDITPGITAVKFVFGELETDVTGPTTALDLSGQMGDNNWFVGDVTVTITSTDAPDAGYSGVASIHYILDGEAEQVVAVDPPTKTASTSFVVAAEGLHTIEAWAVDAAGNVGAHATVQPPVDSSPPVTSATPSGDQVTLDAEDTGSGIEYIVYTIDGGPEQQCPPGTIITIPEGVHTLTVWSVDRAGNVGNRVVIEFRIDKTAPVLHLPAPITVEQANPAGTAVTFAVTATDNLDPTPKVTCVPASGSVFAPGVTTVNCTATDAAGNESTGSFTVTVHDTTPPRITAPPDLRVEANRTHGAAIALAAPAVSDLADPTPKVTNDAPAIFPLGTTTVTWTATDKAGNGATAKQRVKVVDTTPPTMTLTVLQANLWPPNHKLVLAAKVSNVTDICDPSPIVTISVSCKGSGQQGNCSGGGHGLCDKPSDPPDWKLVRNGKVWEVWVMSECTANGSGREYHIDARATDGAGNHTERGATITVAHDQGKK